ncbi:MAG: efflux RND transporter permease subunit [Pseudomonadota bacterium]
MLLSDISIKRPVFASVISLLLVAFGIVSFTRLSLREYPAIDPPVVSITVNYPGAAASIVETRITQVIENRISGIEGIEFIESSSSDGQARVTLEFSIDRDIDDATNDVRDRVSGIADDLPDEADPPDVQKTNADDEVIAWYSLVSEKHSVPELTDYAERYLVERFSVLDGVANVRVGGAQTYAMRVWIDRKALAARNLTAADIEDALRSANVELPAGDIESETRQFTVRIRRHFETAKDFHQLVVAKGTDGYLVRLGDVARVEKGAVEDRVLFRGNGLPRVGIGVSKQSTANTISVVKEASIMADRVNADLPNGMRLEKSYDTATFIAAAIKEVYITLGIAIILVVLMIYLFLGSWRATIIPAVTVPISLIATFTVIYAFGFSINLLTLLALVLAIGIVVDDAIIVLENIARRVSENAEKPLVAAYLGARQVAFAVVATTIVLISVFVPITFLEGDLGRLFTEFALTMAAAIGFSGLTSLTLSAMMASKLLRNETQKTGGLAPKIDRTFRRLRRGYTRRLGRVIRRPTLAIAAFVLLMIATIVVFRLIPQEYTPVEDRGAFNIMVNGPEGATFAYMKDYMDEIERRLMPYTKTGEMQTMLVRAPRSFGNTSSFNSGMVIVLLDDWANRRPATEIMSEIRAKLSDLPGVRLSLVMRQGFTSSSSRPVQFVIGGGTYDQLAEWRDIVLQKIKEDNPGLVSVDWNYKETKPQFEVVVDYDRAAELGVNVDTIGRTLETLLGSRRTTTYIENGEEYDVILEASRDDQRTLTGLNNIYVRSDQSGALIPLSSVVQVSELADAATLNRFNRVRAITIEADLVAGYTIGEALQYLEGVVQDNLPDSVIVDYKGQSQDFKYSQGGMNFVFVMGLLVIFLVLAAQFESYVHPFVIILTVPLAMAGGLIGLYIYGGTLNIYSQIGLLTLVGLAAKNGILIVEFANQIRDGGGSFNRALMKSAQLRLRPILMTSLTAAAGAIPLFMSSGAGSETRAMIGVVVFGGVLSAMVFTIFIVPLAYSLLCRRTGSPHDIERQLEDMA